MTKTQWILMGFGVVMVIVVALVFMHRVKAPMVAGTLPSIVTSTETTATSTTPALSSATPTTPVGPFPINTADTIASWSFKGAYAGNAALVSQANADIAHLTSILGKGQYDDYDIYNGIANDYNLLGDGKMAYDYYNRATQIHPNKGLVYMNLGHLFDELKAYRTAADAYAKSVAVESSVLAYHLARLDYITKQFPNDTVLVTAAFADASKQFGDTASVLTIEAQWLTSTGRYADAIKAWQAVKTLSPSKDTSAIDTAIAHLKAKL